jgi:hypothetical protein
VEGRYTPWHVESATLALKIFSRYLFLEPEDVIHSVWTRMTESILRAVITFLTGQKFHDLTLRETDIGQWFFHNSLYQEHPHLETFFHLRHPIIGIGAPASIFLKEVSAALHTDLVTPEFHQVANAVGAVAGSVMVAEELLVYPRLSNSGLDVIGYYLQAGEERQEYEELDRALRRAREIAQERAHSAALRSGADNPQVSLTETADGIDTYRIRAQALGNPRLG